MSGAARALKKWFVYPIFGPSLDDQKMDLTEGIKSIEEELKAVQRQKRESEQRKLMFAARNQDKQFQLECARCKSFENQEQCLLNVIMGLTQLSTGVEIMRIDDKVTDIQTNLKPVLERISSSSAETIRAEQLTELMHNALDGCNRRMEDLALLTNFSSSAGSDAATADYSHEFRQYRAAYEYAMMSEEPSGGRTVCPPGSAPSATFNY